MSNLELFWHNYKYYPYEKDLAKKELLSFFENSEIKERKDSVIVNGTFSPDMIKELTYFSKGRIAGDEIYTIQQKLENGAAVRSKRQNTRYSAHGLHEYKGKFNPQVVRGLLNIFKISSNSLVLDPFCGSGTTLTECAHKNVSAIGTDINPLATKIANAKILALNSNYRILEKEIFSVYNSFKKGLKNQKNFSIREDERGAYLSKWFNEDILTKIEIYRKVVIEKSSKFEDILLILASNILRDYSLQEPSDLRIRRRTSPMPDVKFEDCLDNQLKKFISTIKKSQSIIGVKESNNYAINQDIKLLEPNKFIENDSFDFAITSPPYATALPYIDTQRLSLVWLDMINPKEIRPLEGQLIGSREFNKKSQLSEWNHKLKTNYFQLPEEIYNLCINLQSSLIESDGFRRQAVPSLLYRYFSEMKESFISVNQLLKKNAYFTLIVGFNKTTIGGEKYEINTPKLLGILGEQVNFQFKENIELQTYRRYGIHSSNSVNKESLIILQKK